MPDIADIETSASAKATADEAGESRLYAICILFPLSLSQKDEQVLLKEVETILEEAGGRQVARDAWGQRGLAYPIKGQTEGKYVVYHYDIDPAKLREADEALRIVPNLLRHLAMKPPKGYRIVKFSEQYEEWLKNREKEEERREREREEELNRRVVERAKRRVKRVEEEKEKEKESAVTTAAKTDKAELSEKLEKLISDDLDI